MNWLDTALCSFYFLEGVAGGGGQGRRGCEEWFFKFLCLFCNLIGQIPFPHPNIVTFVVVSSICIQIGLCLNAA